MTQFDQDNKYVGDSIDLDDVVGAGGFVPEGRYTAQLAASTGVAASKASGKPMVHAIWEIAEGDRIGFEISDYYPMTISPPKRPGGKPFSYGLAKLKADLRSLGRPWSGPFPTQNGCGDQEKAANALARAAQGKLIDLAVIKSERKDKEGNPVLDEQGKQRYDYRPRVLGLAGESRGSVDTSGDPLGL